MSIEIIAPDHKKHIFLCDKIDFHISHLFGKIIYDWTLNEKKTILFLKKTRVTKIIDLRKTPEELFTNFKTNTKNEIHRIEKNRKGVEIDYYASAKSTTVLVEQMFQEKAISRIKESLYQIPPDNVQYLTISHEKQLMVAHSYLLDQKTKTVLLRTSASLFRAKDSIQRNLIGSLNRYLHWQAILHFKKHGYWFYDLGGLGFIEEYNDPASSIQNICKFKNSFGGELKHVYQFIPIHNEIAKSRFFCRCKIIAKLFCPVQGKENRVLFMNYLENKFPVLYEIRHYNRIQFKSPYLALLNWFETRLYLKLDRWKKVDFYTQISPVEKQARKVASTLMRDIPFILKKMKCLGVQRNEKCIDIGCGKGYVISRFANYFSFVTGIELSREATDIAKINLKKLKIKNVSILNVDARSFVDIDQYTVFYLFNPFDATVTSCVADNISESARRKPRRILVVYNNPIHADVFLQKGFSMIDSIERLFPCHFYELKQNVWTKI